MNSQNLKKISSLILIFLILLFFFPGCSGGEKEESSGITTPQINTLSYEEREEGWILLFDGNTFKGWRGLGREDVPAGHWIIEDGAIKKVPSVNVPLQEDGQPLRGGDLMTVRSFEDFELYCEWKISPAGNSGIKYNVSEEMSVSFPPENAALGFEYQILDDENHPDAENGDNRTAAALYDLLAPECKLLKPVGEFNSSRIIFKGNHGEHWLNGTKVLEYDLGTERMDSLLKASKYRDIPGFADKRKGHIVLQDHTDAVWFRSIKIRLFKPEISGE